MKTKIINPKSTNRSRVPMNITLPVALKKRIERKTFSRGISASRWFEELVRAELARGGRAK